MGKKIITYNVNGIRAAASKGLFEWVAQENPDILHIQETKAEENQIDLSALKNLGYSVLWHSAQKKGYSGVATFTKLSPQNIFTGIGIEEFDAEGRFLRMDVGSVTFINSYFPSGTTGDVRQSVKEAYLEAVLDYCKNLLNQQPNIVISGDFNICHKPIDINHPKKHEGVSGFLPNEREWMDRLQNAGFVDSFRQFNTNADEYSWWSYRSGARVKNLGWRIDYHWVSQELSKKMTAARILQTVVHSDHCPVVAEFDL